LCLKTYVRGTYGPPQAPPLRCGGRARSRGVAGARPSTRSGGTCVAPGRDESGATNAAPLGDRALRPAGTPFSCGEPWVAVSGRGVEGDEVPIYLRELEVRHDRWVEEGHPRVFAAGRQRRRGRAGDETAAVGHDVNPGPRENLEGVDAEEPVDGDVQAGLLAHLTDHAILHALAVMGTPAGELPLAAMVTAEQDASVAGGAHRLDSDRPRAAVA